MPVQVVRLSTLGGQFRSLRPVQDLRCDPVRRGKQQHASVAYGVQVGERSESRAKSEPESDAGAVLLGPAGVPLQQTPADEEQSESIKEGRQHAEVPQERGRPREQADSDDRQAWNDVAHTLP